MKKLLFILFLLVSNLSYSQNYKVDFKFSYWTDTVYNKEIIPIVNLFKKYFESMPDSMYDNPYWNNKEKRIYQTFDFSANVLFNPENPLIR